MRELPILFSAPMVRAILEGRKTVTRRLVKGIALEWLGPEMFSAEYVASAENGLCPYGNPGNRLWVREAWRAPASLDDRAGGQIAEACLGAGYRNPWCPVQYEADSALNSQKDWREFGTSPGQALPGRYRHARFMPRWASRITLEVTGVRVERLHDITTEQILSEGVVSHLREHDAVVDLRQQFEALWDGLAKPGTRWADNPWVWVVAFRRVEVSHG